MPQLFCISTLCLYLVFAQGTGAQHTPGGIEAVRLEGGPNNRSGRVEILSEGVWGTVCRDNFDNNAARVVCRSLGLQTTGASVAVRSLFTFADRGTIILLDEVVCRGDELSLNQCQHRPIGEHNCNHYRDVGIICANELIDQVRLVDGLTAQAGRLEVLSMGAWGTVCADSFDANAGNVICRSLGFPIDHVQVVLASKFYGIGAIATRILLDDVTCRGNESSINACQHRDLGAHDCHHLDDIGIACGSQDVIDAVRLVDGPSDHAGRLEIMSHGAWGTVCNDYFSDNAARVVCRSLGFSSNPTNLTLANTLYPADADMPVLLDDVRCLGNEPSLNECQHRPIGEENCFRHTRDVGIICELAKLFGLNHSHTVTSRIYSYC